MNKKSTFFSFLCTAFLIGAQAQNLVPNPGFEVQDTCPAVSQISKAQPWVSATLGTPDLYNSTCASQNLTARTGIGSSGVYVLNSFANNREYMEAPLTAPMVGGQLYNVSFYVKRLNYRYASDRIGAHFHVGNYYQTTTSVLSLMPQVDHPQGVMMTGNSWIQVSGSFVASGSEDHILIGSFSSDANTDTIVANSSSTSKVAYYAIDDISVTAATGVNENSSADDLVSLYPNPATTEVSLLVSGGSLLNSVSIMNELGQQVYRKENPVIENGVYTISTGGFSKGLYFISVETGFGRTVKKLSIAE